MSYRGGGGVIVPWLPTATADTLGVVKVDGETIFVDENGFLTTVPQKPGVKGEVYEFIIDENIPDLSPNNGPTVTYAGTNKDFTPVSMDFTTGTFDPGSWKDTWLMNIARPCVLGHDGKVKYYLNPDNVLQKVDGSDAPEVTDVSADSEVMVEFGQVWIKEENDGDGIHHIYLSNKQADGFDCASHTNEAGEVKDHYYVAKYLGCYAPDDTEFTKVRSISGLLGPGHYDASAVYVEDQRKNCQVHGPGWDCTEWSFVRMLNYLLVLLGKTVDIQSCFGEGISVQGITGNQTDNNDKGPFYAKFNDKDADGLSGEYWFNSLTVFHIDNFYGGYGKLITGIGFRGPVTAPDLPDQFILKMNPPYNYDVDPTAPESVGWKVDDTDMPVPNTWAISKMKLISGYGLVPGETDMDLQFADGYGYHARFFSAPSNDMNMQMIMCGQESPFDFALATDRSCISMLSYKEPPASTPGGDAEGEVYEFIITDSVSDPNDRVAYAGANEDFTPAHMNFAGPDSTFDWGSWKGTWLETLARPCVLGHDGNVRYYLNPDNVRQNINGEDAPEVTGSDPDCEVMVEFDQVWIKEVEDSPGVHHIYLSNKQAEGFDCASHTNAAGTVKEHYYVAKYQSCQIDNKMRSLAGHEVGAGTGSSLIAARNACTAHGDGWDTLEWSFVRMMQYLLIMLGKTTNAQECFGFGCYGESESNLSTLGTGYSFNHADTKGAFFGSAGDELGLVTIYYIDNYWYSWGELCIGLTANMDSFAVKMTPPYILSAEQITDSSYKQIPLPSWDKQTTSTGPSPISAMQLVPGYGLFPSDFDNSFNTASSSPNYTADYDKWQKSYYCDTMRTNGTDETGYYEEYKLRPASIGGSYTYSYFGSGREAGPFNMSFDTKADADYGTEECLPRLTYKDPHQ